MSTKTKTTRLTNKFGVARGIDKTFNEQPNIHTTFIYSHGNSATTEFDLPNNVIVIAQCNNEAVYGDFRYDLSKFLFVAQNLKSSLPIDEYVKSLLEVFNRRGQPFCCYTKTCPAMVFSPNDEQFNMRIYDTKESKDILKPEELKTADEINEHVYKFFVDEVLTVFSQMSFQDFVKNTELIKDIFPLKNYNISPEDFDTYLNARKYIFKDIGLCKTGIKRNATVRSNSNSNRKIEKITLQNILGGLDKTQFHVVVVNTCRTGPACALDVSPYMTLQQQFKQYQQFKALGKHALPDTEDFIEDAVGKVNKFKESQNNQSHLGGKKQLVSQKKTIKKQTKKQTKK
jgi:hypothetical protein